jgi:hypothetical protein
MTDVVRRNAFSSVAQRWPTILGIVFGVGLLLAGTSGDKALRQLAEVLMLLPLLYLAVAASGRQRWTWPFLVASVPFLFLAQLQPWVPPVVVLAAVAVGAVAWGAGHGLHHEHDFRLQIAGMVVFGAFAVVALLVNVDVARYVLAAGWFGHAVWDWVHLSRKRVVEPSYAECCGTIDVLAAVGLVALPLL